MSTIDFYYSPGSAPCRAVLLTAQALGIELNLYKVDQIKGDHMKEEYLKMNPEHSIPTITDGEFCLWESSVIMSYLANKYGKEEQVDTLYPKDPQTRARVDQKLYFATVMLNQRFPEYYYPQIMNKSPADPKQFKKIEDAFELFNTSLEGQKFAIGNKITLADLSLVSSVSTFEAMQFPLEKYPNVERWFKDCKDNVIGYEEVNETGLVILRNWLVKMEYVAQNKI